MKKTIIDLFESSVSKYGDNVFLWEKLIDKFEPTTYKETKEIALKIGAGLVTFGIKPKDTLSILSEGSNNWIISELGMLYMGAINVPLSIKLEESNDLLFRLIHAEVKIIMVSSKQLTKIRKIRSQLPLLEQVILLDRGIKAQKDEIYIEDLIDKGVEYLKKHKEEFLKIGQELQNDDIATISYTSGTTADPKGVMLSHRNYTANIEQALTCMTIPSTYRTLIILPLDHCFAHVVGFYTMIACGASVATVQVGKTPIESLKNIPLNINEIKPDFLLSVPALSKSLRKNIENGIRAKGKILETLFNFALKVSYVYNKDGYTRGSGLSFLLYPLVKLFDVIIFKKVRTNFGGNLKFFVGGGALLDAELQRFFYAIGIPIYQGYGLSEATPVISTNTIKKHRFGSSGVMVSPMEICIKDEDGNDLPIGNPGEIVIKGENVMLGYWKNPVSTAETLCNGWLYTGDLGYIGKDGLLYVLGRSKSLLIASDGEKYSPEGMEEAFVSQSSYIDNVVIYNNQSPYTSILIVPSKDAIHRHLVNNKISDADYAKVAVELIHKEVNKYKTGGEFHGQFPERWLPSTFAVLEEDFTEKNGMINSTMKIVRNKVEKHFAERIDYMYSPDGKNHFNAKNLSVFAK